MLPVKYPASRFDIISSVLEGFNENMVNALQRTVLELRQYELSDFLHPNKKKYLSKQGNSDEK